MAPFHFSRLITSLSSSAAGTNSSVASSTTSKTFCRHVATARRAHKALRTAPAPSAAITSKYNIPPTSQIVFNPPPSIPSPYHTPPIFLPPQDPRRALFAQSYAHDNPYSAQHGGTAKDLELPPLVKKPRQKALNLNLSKEDIEEMRRLRQSDEFTWSRSKLAEKFGCTEFFVGICVQGSTQRMEWAKANLERIKERWGAKRRTARLERTKRKELWNRDG